MAAASTLQYGRQKKSVYGKASKSNWSTTFFDDSDDELSASRTSPAAKPVTQRSASVKASYPVQKTEVKKAPTPKVAKTKAVKQDTFDVPSSDEEPSPPPKAVQKPAFRTNKRLVDDSAETQATLAPWERQRNTGIANERGNGALKRNKYSAASPEDQLQSDLLGVAGSQARKQTVSPPSKRVPTPVRSNTSAFESNGLSSAAARLAARKKTMELTTSPALGNAKPGKRVELEAAPGETPRKRAKTNVSSRGSSVDVAMLDDDAAPVCDANDNGVGSSDAAGDIYDFPDSSADESSKPRPRSKSPKVTKKPVRQSKPAMSTTRSTAVKGLSAPARLAEMIQSDSDMTEPSTRSPTTSMSRGVTPRQPSTPPSNKRSSPETAIKSRGNITPKQAQLWNRLLPSQAAISSPSALAMRDLTISGEKRSTSDGISAAKRLAKSQSDVGRRRTRLVDRLKASAQSSSEDEADESSNESSDVDMSEAVEAAPERPPIVRAASTQSRTDSAQGSQSQSRSQPTTLPTAGLKRTYASQRSHLAEDNLEDDLMAGLMDETPKQPVSRAKTFSRSQPNTKKDAFDMDDSDGDGGDTGGIRTIHELRAAGRNIRGTEDIEQLLEDLENNAASHKSRRRSALIDLATKLADKNFASRFIGQGCDARLARQCGASRDDIADFLLGGSVALLLASDPPEHTLRTLQEHDTASWLGSILTSAEDISKMAKDRRNNMAGASQTSLLELVQLLQTQQSLWSDDPPATLCTRLIALKALDLLITKLRRAGDKSEILDPEHLPLVLAPPASSGNLDGALSISILESLSAASLPLTWAGQLLDCIAGTLTALDTTSSARNRHTFFLTLRLCLNLTTDNPRNCYLLSQKPTTVPFLLQTVLDGFATLSTSPLTTTQIPTTAAAEADQEAQALTLDLLVLALGTLISLFDHSSLARRAATASPETTQLTTALVMTLVAGQQKTLEAESVEEGASNVALGYLAVALANMCSSSGISAVEEERVDGEAPAQSARELIIPLLPGKTLAVVGDAVEEFMLVHRQVDGLRMGGAGGTHGDGDEEGEAAWGGFTERLRGVLERVRAME